MASEQTENPISGAIPENEHKGGPETHGAISDFAAEGQRPREGAVSAGLGESGQDTAKEGQESQGKSREEEEIERTDREFSETIEKLDSVLLEEAGGKEGQKEGDGVDINATEELGAKTEESEGETAAQVPGGETAAQVPGGETAAQVPGGETAAQVPGAETAAQVPGGETAAQVPGGETAAQVPGGETAAQVPGGETAAQVPGGETVAQVPGGETAAQVPGGETAAQVPGAETAAQVPGAETAAQMPGAETAAQVPGAETAAQMPGAESAPQVLGKEGTVHVSVKEAPYIEIAEEITVQVSEDWSASQETCPQVTTEEHISPQPVAGTDADMHEIVTEASQAWIDTLVKNIVTEVTSEGTRAGEAPADCHAHVSGESADSSSEPAEEGEHSCAGRTTIPEQVQVILEKTGAVAPGTDVQAQVSDDNTVITVQVGCEEVTHSPGQTGGQQVGLFSTEGVAVSLIDQETAAEVKAGRQVKAPGQETHEEMTPDLLTVPDREGTADPGQPTACREKEWPPLICTGSEVRADTAEQRRTVQGTVHETEQCPGAPDMKDREMVEDGVILTPETPIEREIRLTMERETTLRQERGISVPVGEPELVEVRRKTVVVKPEALSGKERQLAGAQMQREIQLETQREQDLVEQGKVMGTYDRGPQQELQEKKMIFESMNTESSDPPLKRRQSEIQKSASIEDEVDAPPPSNHVFLAASPAADVKKGPSYAEANGSNIIILDHASMLRKSAPVNSSAPADVRRTSPAESRRSTPADLRFTRSSSGNSPLSEFPVAAPGSPFQLLRSPSPRSLLEREIEEVKERERELRKQRTSIYGRDNGMTENSQTASNTDIQSGIYQPERPNWGKLEVNWPPNNGVTINGQQDQAWDSPRTRRQRNALIQSWESGNPNPGDDN